MLHFLRSLRDQLPLLELFQESRARDIVAHYCPAPASARGRGGSWAIGWSGEWESTLDRINSELSSRCRGVSVKREWNSRGIQGGCPSCIGGCPQSSGKNWSKWRQSRDAFIKYPIGVLKRAFPNLHLRRLILTDAGSAIRKWVLSRRLAVARTYSVRSTAMLRRTSAPTTTWRSSKRN